MALVDYDFYTNTYYGEPMPETTFAPLERRAEDLVLHLVRMDQEGAGASPFLPDIRKAICAEIEYLSVFGAGVSVYGKSGSGFTVGKVSVNEGDSKSGGASVFAPAVYMYLEQTGLLNPNVHTTGNPWPYGWGWVSC